MKLLTKQPCHSNLCRKRRLRKAVKASKAGRKDTLGTSYQRVPRFVSLLKSTFQAKYKYGRKRCQTSFKMSMWLSSKYSWRPYDIKRTLLLDNFTSCATYAPIEGVAEDGCCSSEIRLFAHFQCQLWDREGRAACISPEHKRISY